MIVLYLTLIPIYSRKLEKLIKIGGWDKVSKLCGIFGVLYNRYWTRCCGVLRAGEKARTISSRTCGIAVSWQEGGRGGRGETEEDG